MSCLPSRSQPDDLDPRLTGKGSRQCKRCVFLGVPLSTYTHDSRAGVFMKSWQLQHCQRIKTLLDSTGHGSKADTSTFKWSCVKAAAWRSFCQRYAFSYIEMTLNTGLVAFMTTSSRRMPWFQSTALIPLCTAPLASAMLTL